MDPSTHVFVQLLRQLLDVPQYFLLVPLLSAHPLHFVSHELGENGRLRGAAGQDPATLPYPSCSPRHNAASQQVPGSVPRGDRRAQQSKGTTGCGDGCQTVAHLIEQVDGAVRGPSLGHEAGERHPLQHLGEEVVLRQPPLPQEGCLQAGSKLSAATSTGSAGDTVTAARASTRAAVAPRHLLPRPAQVQGQGLYRNLQLWPAAETRLQQGRAVASEELLQPPRCKEGHSGHRIPLAAVTGT